MAETFVLSLGELQPSQLYLSEAKVAAVRTGSRPLAPLPVKRLGGRVVLTDGHTRAFVAWRSGQRQIEVHWDGDDLSTWHKVICISTSMGI